MDSNVIMESVRAIMSAKISKFDALEIAECLLTNLDVDVWKVTYRVMKNRHGHYENGGRAFFWTEEDADAFANQFIVGADADADVDEIDISEAEIDELIELVTPAIEVSTGVVP